MCYKNNMLNAFFETHIKEYDYADYKQSYQTFIAMDWLMSEYEEPKVDWSKVEVDTKILVTDYFDGKGNKRYFAKYEDGRVYAFTDGKSSFTSSGVNDIDCWKYAKLYEEGE